MLIVFGAKLKLWSAGVIGNHPPNLIKTTQKMTRTETQIDGRTGVHDEPTMRFLYANMQKLVKTNACSFYGTLVLTYLTYQKFKRLQPAP